MLAVYSNVTVFVKLYVWFKTLYVNALNSFIYICS